MNRQDTIARAIDRLAPGAEWALRGDQYSDLEWLDQVQPKPDEATLMVVADEIEGTLDVPAITKAQALLYLLSIDKTEADVLSAIATIDDPTERAVAEIEWNYRQPFQHDHPLFAALGPAVGITDMEAAFRVAALL